MEKFAARIRRLADMLEISLAEVARRAGISDRSLSHYLAGRSEPNLATLIRLANVLGTTPNDLLGVEVNADKKISERDRLVKRAHLTIEQFETERLRLIVAMLEAGLAQDRRSS